jgi:hypothetical protein
VLEQAPPRGSPTAQRVVALVCQADVAGGAVHQPGAALRELAGERGLTNEGAGHRHEVGLAGFDERVHRLGAAHAAHGDHLGVHALAQAPCPRRKVGLRRRFREQAVKQEVIGGTPAVDGDVLPSRVARRDHHSARNLEGIQAGVHQQARHPHRFLDAESSGGRVHHAELHRQGLVGRHCRAYCPHHVNGEAGAALRRPAPVVIAAIGERGQKLADEVAVGPVDVHAVEACDDGAPRAGRERRHGLLDLIGPAGWHLAPGERVRHRRGRERRQAAHPGLASRVRQLAEHQAARPMHRVGEPAQPRDQRVVVDARLAARVLAAGVAVEVPRKDRSHPVRRERLVELDQPLRRGAVGRRHGLRRARTDQAVARGQGTERPLGKQRLAHLTRSLSAAAGPRPAGGNRRATVVRRRTSVTCGTFSYVLPFERMIRPVRGGPLGTVRAHVALRCPRIPTCAKADRRYVPVRHDQVGGDGEQPDLSMWE